MAPLVFARSLHWRMWVVDFQLGPSICLATSFQEAVFPTPAGPVISKLGGFGDKLADVNAWRKFRGIDSSSKVRGECSLSQLAI
jgi:hypothetical protein